MLEKKTIIGSINVKPSGHIEIREDTQVYDDGQPLGSPSYHRYVLSPGDSLDGQPEQISAIARLTWTPAVIEEYNRRQRTIRA